MAAADLTAARLRELLHYDPETGAFTRLTTQSSRAQAGSSPGCINKDGYLVIRLDYRLYYGQRLAWLYVMGEWPQNEVDHWDGDKSNNRWENLRDVTHGVNNQNRRAPAAGKKSGLPLGVFFNKRQNSIWAGIVVDGQMRFLGTHQTPEAAHQTFLAAKRQLHAGCTL